MTRSWLALGLCLLVAACSAPTRSYIEDRDAGTSFAIPQEWQVVDLVGGVVEEGPLDLPDPTLVERIFYPPLEGSPTPPWPPTTEVPIGYTRVWSLTAEEQEEMSIKRLRNILLPIDRLRTESPDRISVITQSLLASEGYRGEQITFTMEVPSEDPSSPPDEVTISQTTYLDPFTTKGYVFAVGCSVDCFLDNRGTIADIESSWSVIPS